MELLTKEAVLAAQDVHYEVVPVPEWGGDIRIRSMTGADRDAWETWLVQNRSDDGKANLANLRARLAMLCCVDADGNRLFSEADVAALGAKSAKALDRVYAASTRLNAIGPEDVADLVKPSAPAPGADSGSVSPVTLG
jgi:hypothetical protein